MRKRLFSILLALSLLLSNALPVLATEQTAAEVAALSPDLTISTAAELLVFAEACRLDQYSVGLTVALQSDIDLTDADFFGIPQGGKGVGFAVPEQIPLRHGTDISAVAVKHRKTGVPLLFHFLHCLPQCIGIQKTDNLALRGKYIQQIQN